MNIQTIVLLVVIVAIVAFALLSVCKNKNKCSSCGNSACCSSKKCNSWDEKEGK